MQKDRREVWRTDLGGIKAWRRIDLLFHTSEIVPVGDSDGCKEESLEEGPDSAPDKKPKGGDAKAGAAGEPDMSGAISVLQNLIENA